MSSRHKNKHKARHRTHAVKPANLAENAPSRMLDAIPKPKESTDDAPVAKRGAKK